MAAPGFGRSARALWWLAALLALAGCMSRGERLARAYCGACHEFPDPSLLDKKTWLNGVLPVMAMRVGASPETFNAMVSNPYLAVIDKAVSPRDFSSIVKYYVGHAPDTLPPEALPARPDIDPPFFRTRPFVTDIPGDAVVTLLKADSVHRRIFVGDAARNQLLVYGWDGRRISSYTLGSPPTDLIVDGDRILVLESGILSPSNQARGRLAQYELGADDSLRFRSVVLDSLIRPVFAARYDFDRDGADDFLVCEFGNDRGRLALYRQGRTGYAREVLSSTPGCIRAEIHDLTGDGAPDIVALFAQADERIMLFENDGTGHFGKTSRVLARFPPVYGSMDFSMHDMDGDGHLDIVYVNGDNFDYSRILKPYHGVHILRNDGKNNFRERYFFPIYGAAVAAVADFNGDGRLDMLTTSNFPDQAGHPERGIMYFENVGPFEFGPHAFRVSASNQWNRIALADLNHDGRPDALIGAMSLASIVLHQLGKSSAALTAHRDPLLYFENQMPGAARATSRPGARGSP